MRKPNGELYDNFDDELEAIRLALYEETKNLTTEERLARLDAVCAPVMKEFNMKYSDLTPVIPHKWERKPA